jgi:hypothetical protein
MSAAAEKMATKEGMDADVEEAPESAPESMSPQKDMYKKAGRTIRHAISDGDDEALADALCALYDAHSANSAMSSPEPEESEGGGGQTLAKILSKGRK